MYEAWAPQYDILSAASWRSTTNRYQKYFELIVAGHLCCSFMLSRNNIIREWISMFGDLPGELTKDVPPTAANGT